MSPLLLALWPSPIFHSVCLYQKDLFYRVNKIYYFFLQFFAMSTTDSSVILTSDLCVHLSLAFVLDNINIAFSELKDVCLIRLSLYVLFSPPSRNQTSSPQVWSEKIGDRLGVSKVWFRSGQKSTSRRRLLMQKKDRKTRFRSMEHKQNITNARGEATPENGNG